MQAILGSAETCLLARPELIPLATAADLTVAACCFLLPLGLWLRGDPPSRPARVGLALFLAAIGLGQILGTIGPWYPACSAAGALKALAVAAALAAIILAWRQPPAAPASERLHKAELRLRTALRGRAGPEPRLQDAAEIDRLTGAANRRHFDHLLDTEWRRSARAKTPIALLVCDIDRFKRFNARHGHPAGDAYLQNLAGAAGFAIRRPGDFLARIDGDAFAAILPGTDLKGAEEVAERILSGIRTLSQLPDYRGGDVTVSIGAAAMLPGADATPAGLIGQAERALRQAKQQGGDRVMGMAPAAAS